MAAIMSSKVGCLGRSISFELDISLNGGKELGAMYVFLKVSEGSVACWSRVWMS